MISRLPSIDKANAFTLFDDEEDESDGICFLDIKSMKYNPDNLEAIDLEVDAVIQKTIRTIQLTRKDDPKAKKFRSHTSSLYSTPARSGRKESIAKMTLQALIDNSPWLRQLLLHLFWLVDLKFFFTDKDAEIKDLEDKIAVIYRDFAYPFQTNGKYSPKVIDRFFYCLPYFLTQALQDIFIRKFCGNPTTMGKDFRMRLCSFLVDFFTGIKPIDSLLRSRLSFFFIRAPEADVADLRKKESLFPTTVMLPTEDVNSLVDIERRARPTDYAWHAASVSPIVAKSFHRKVLPYHHDTIWFFNKPKNDEDDYLKNLPPLLPSYQDQKDVTDITKYDPKKETRSLLLRSRRPHIIEEFRKEKDEFHKHSVERRGKMNADIVELHSKLKKVRQKHPAVLDVWLKDLAKLQEDKKRNETPEFKKLSDIVKGKEGEKEKEQEEREERENSFNYVPYFKVITNPDEIKKFETK